VSGKPFSCCPNDFFVASQKAVKDGPLVQPLRSGWPDLANFRLLGDCFLWVVFVVQIFGLFFSHEKELFINFYRKWVGLHFGRFFSQTHLVTLPAIVFTSGKA
jgi:hypothetical protein